MWCQNPETWNPAPELMLRDAKCVLLGECALVCPTRAITFDQNNKRIIDRNKCDLCFKCVSACPSGAISIVGKQMTVDEVMSEIESDEPFLWRSGGGVTISGGEPLNQHIFTCNLLKACKDRALHTALDTSGYCDWSKLEKALNYTDLILYDIKHMDTKQHKQATGVGNTLILENLRKISRKIPDDKKIWLRIPLIPGYNDSKNNLEKTALLAKEIKAERISILPFHKLGEGKYKGLGREYPMSNIALHDKIRIDEIKSFMQSLGLEVHVGK